MRVTGANRMPQLAYSGEIFELYLAPEYQGMGLGRRMFQAARGDLSAHGYHSFVVWALAGNERAVVFYEKLGGSVVRARPSDLAGKRGAHSVRVHLIGPPFWGGRI